MTKRTPDEIRDLAVELYKKMLDQSCKGDADRMLAKDLEKDPSDGGKKMRGRAAVYDPHIRFMLEILGLDENNHTV